MKLSNQALGAIMAALQNSLSYQTDIVPVLLDWDLYIQDGELFVENPPYLEPLFPEDLPEMSEDPEDNLFDFLTDTSED